MKAKSLVIAAIVLFLLVNTYRLWDFHLGIWDMPLFMFLCIYYLIIVIGLAWQLFGAILERFTDKKRLLGMTLTATILILTFLYPSGMVNFERAEGKNLLVATAEGVANCTTTFKLKENNRFVERNVCFGVTEIQGNYTVKGDTLFFSDVELGRGESNYYTFAVIDRADTAYGNTLGALVRYEHLGDTTGRRLYITEDYLKPYSRDILKL